MNIYISADMEGISGVTHSAQCRPGHGDYERFRRLLTAEVNAAVEGAVAGGARTVLVNDAHLTMRNIVIEDLHPAAELISGSTKLLGQMEGIDSSFDGVFFVGYHEGDGISDGLIGHTYMSGTLRRVFVNDVELDEAGVNARIAAAFGVPVALLTGDDRVCAAATEAFPGIEVAPVKRAIDRLTGRNRSVVDARRLITERAEAATRALAAQALAPIAIELPARFRVEFRSTSAAHFCTAFPGVRRLTATEIEIEHPEFLDAFRHFWGLANAGMAAQDGLFSDWN